MVRRPPRRLAPPELARSQQRSPRRRLGRAARSAVRVSGGGHHPFLYYIYLLWAVNLFDPHRWIASFGPSAFGRLAAILFVPLLIGLVLQLPGILARRPSWVWYPLMLMFVLSAVTVVPFALNRGMAWESTQPLVLWYLLGVGTLAFATRPRDVAPILTMIFLQFAWWLVHGKVTSGVVGWHPLLANLDGYGALMVVGLGFCVYYGLALPSRWMRRFAILVAGLCLLGVIGSFARGAFFGAVAVVGIMFLRAKRKGRAAAGIVGAVAVTLVGAALVSPDGNFWSEIQSSFTEGKEEGTGRDRWVLWTMAIEVWKEHPVTGVGLGNFGVFASSYFDVSSAFDERAEQVGHYGINPGRLYRRSLHSMYFQILSELGTLGSLLFVALIVDFWRRNRRLRTRAAQNRWRSMSDIDLYKLAVAVESAMVGLLVTGAFYAVYISMHWLYTLLTLGVLLDGVTSEIPGPQSLRRSPKRGDLPLDGRSSTRIRVEPGSPGGARRKSSRSYAR